VNVRPDPIRLIKPRPIDPLRWVGGPRAQAVFGGFRRYSVERWMLQR
jgi:hypothetical protein